MLYERRRVITLRIAVIDDSSAQREQLSGYIKEYYSGNPIYRQVDLFENGEQFMECWRPGAYDLLFIDIFLDGINGLEIAEKVRNSDADCLMVFTTNSSDFAVRGFELRVSDYLVKPFSYEKFKDTLKYCERSMRSHARYIEVKESRTMIKIRLDDIIFTDYFNHYIQINTKTRTIRSYMKFETFSPYLLCYPQFLCCYRNCIVNMDRVISLEKNDFIMDTDERVPITRKNRQEIHQRYADYQFLRLSGGV